MSLNQSEIVESSTNNAIPDIQTATETNSPSIQQTTTTPAETSVETEQVQAEEIIQNSDDDNSTILKWTAGGLLLASGTALALSSGGSKGSSAPANTSQHTVTQPTSETKPTVETQPTTETNPTVETQPATETKPTVETQPTAETNPTVETQPTTETKPTVETQPATETKPTVETQPATETKPTGETQPATETKPTVETQPATETKPTAETQPVTETKPTGETQPTAETKPIIVETQPTTESQSNENPVVEEEKTQNITTKIYYPNGDVVTHSAETALDLHSIQYKTFSAQEVSTDSDQIIYIDKSHPAFAGLVAGAKAYIAGLSDEEVQTAIETAYQVDTDGDGVIDALDRDPNVWNVSERDLRNFSVLAYEKGNDLVQAFDGNGNPSVLHNYQDGQYKIGKVDVENMDLDTLTKHWDLIEFGNPGSGLQYIVFGNGKNELGEYKNIVVAFRGTEATSPNDISADLKIYDGRVPTQAKYLEDIAKTLEQYNAENIYSTGHSLGGYLAQYFAAHTMQSNEEWQESFTHSALFNPVPLPNTSHTATARQLSDQFTATEVTEENFNKTESYVIKGEFVSDGALLAGAGIAAAETAKGSFWGFLGGLLLAPVTGGASLALGTALGTGVGAGKGIINGAQAVEGLGTYNNTNLFDFKEGDLWGKHNLSSFFEQDGQLKLHFTNGYRMDSHYLNDDEDQDGLTDYQEAKIGTNVYLKDTDNDGIIDAIEVKVAANALNADETPWAVDGGETHFDGTPMLITAEVEQNGETSVKGIILIPELQGDGVLYTVADVMDRMPSVLPFDDITMENNLAYITASDNNDIIVVGNGNALINSGNGNDTILFNSLNQNGIAYLNDFDPNNDTLAFAQNTFNDANLFQYNQAQGQLSYNNIHFATFEQGLALDIQQFEIV